MEDTRRKASVSFVNHRDINEAKLKSTYVLKAIINKSRAILTLG